MRKGLVFTAGLLVAAASLFSCKKETVTSTVYYTVPATYTFDNVNDTAQLKLLLMADQIGAEINNANTFGVQVSAQKLKNMLANTGGYFTDSSATLTLNNSGLKLEDYCSPAIKTALYNYFDSIELYSGAAATADSGIAGTTVSSVSASKKYLLSPTGIFYSQVVKKAVMGLCAYNISSVYLKDSIGNAVDNSTVVPGWGTAMEHHWDEAFGFLGAPVNFPSNTAGLKYLASYSNQVNAGLSSNSRFMNAFLKGRGAISNKDLAGKQAQADSIVRLLDQFNAACVVQEMKETDENLDNGDVVAAYGTLSEAWGFVQCFKFNVSGKRTITDAQITQLEQLFDADNTDNPDLYKFVNANYSSTAEVKQKTDAIRQFIAGIYGFSAAQLPLL